MPQQRTEEGGEEKEEGRRRRKLPFQTMVTSLCLLGKKYFYDTRDRFVLPSSNLKRWLNFRFFSFTSIDCSIDVCGNVSEVPSLTTTEKRCRIITGDWQPKNCLYSLDWRNPFLSKNDDACPAKPAWPETTRIRAYPVPPQYQDLPVFLYATRLWNDSYRPIRFGDWVHPHFWGCSSRGVWRGHDWNGPATFLLLPWGTSHRFEASSRHSPSPVRQKWDPIQIKRTLESKHLKNTLGIPGSQISLLLLLVGFIGNLLFGIINLHLGWQNWDFHESEFWSIFRGRSLKHVPKSSQNLTPGPLFWTPTTIVRVCKFAANFIRCQNNPCKENVDPKRPSNMLLQQRLKIAN